MKYELNPDKRYSPLERKLFAQLPVSSKAKGGVTTTMLSAQLYGRAINGRQTVLVALTGLKEKVTRNREPFRIIKTVRRGPHPMEWWVEAK